MWKISPFDEWLNSEVVVVKREHVGVDIHSSTSHSVSLTPTNSILSNKTTMFNTLSTFLTLSVSTSAVLSVRLENQSLLFEKGLVSRSVVVFRKNSTFTWIKLISELFVSVGFTVIVISSISKVSPSLTWSCSGRQGITQKVLSEANKEKHQTEHGIWIKIPQNPSWMSINSWRLNMLNIVLAFNWKNRSKLMGFLMFTELFIELCLFAASVRWH